MGFTKQANPTYMSHLEQNAVIGKCFKSHLKTRATVEVEGHDKNMFPALCGKSVRAFLIDSDHIDSDQSEEPSTAHH